MSWQFDYNKKNLHIRGEKSAECIPKHDFKN